MEDDMTLPLEALPKVDADVVIQCPECRWIWSLAVDERCPNCDRGLDSEVH